MNRSKPSIRGAGAPRCAVERVGDYPGDEASSSTSSRAWQTAAVFAVLPALIHLAILSFALAGSTEPAIRISGLLLAGDWAVPILWACVIGGPLISIIASLTLELRGKARSIGTMCGIFAWVLLLVGLVTTLPFPWILVFESQP